MTLVAKRSFLVFSEGSFRLPHKNRFKLETPFVVLETSLVVMWAGEEKERSYVFNEYV